MCASITHKREPFLCHVEISSFMSGAAYYRYHSRIYSLYLSFHSHVQLNIYPPTVNGAGAHTAVAAVRLGLCSITYFCRWLRSCEDGIGWGWMDGQQQWLN